VDPSLWVLLTGPRERVRSLAVDGFRVALGESDAVADIAHAAKLLLVDGSGALRGVYDSDELGLDEAFWRARRVVEEARGSWRVMARADVRGLLLINLGTPQAPRIPEVRRYLREFLSDWRVLDVPWPVRWAVLHLAILPRRPRASAHAYAKIWTPEG